jgi:hypothetical protein
LLLTGVEENVAAASLKLDDQDLLALSRATTSRRQ